MIAKRICRHFFRCLLTSLVTLSAGSINALAEDEQTPLTQPTDESLTSNQTPVNSTPASAAPVTPATVTEATLAPKQRWYQVELLIAERLSETPGANDSYSENLNKPNTFVLQGDITLQDYLFEDNQSFVALPQERRQLNNVAKRLNNASQYDLLFHQAWPQAFIQNQSTPWIDITSESLVLDQPQLSGSVNIKLKRFLHINTQLVLRDLVPINRFSDTENLANLLAEEAELLGLETQDNNLSTHVDNHLLPQEQPSETLHIYTMNQSRKMRSRRLHYLDHPRLALLVRIDPYDPETGLIIPEQQ